MILLSPGINPRVNLSILTKACIICFYIGSIELLNGMAALFSKRSFWGNGVEILNYSQNDREKPDLPQRP